MKKLLGVILGWGLIIISGQVALASEGQAVIRGKMGGPVCHAFSIFEGTTYNVQLTCRGLVVPYSAEITRYVAWYGSTKKGWTYLGQVEGGKVFGRTANAFEQIQLTAEEKARPRRPSELVVATGQFEALDFSQAAAGEDIAIAETSDTTGDVVVQPKSDNNVIGSVVGVVGRALAIGFAVLLIGVVVMSFITRRKGL